jgi:hypothetical protein
MNAVGKRRSGDLTAAYEWLVERLKAELPDLAIAGAEFDLGNAYGVGTSKGEGGITAEDMQCASSTNMSQGMMQMTISVSHGLRIRSMPIQQKKKELRKSLSLSAHCK